MLNITKIYVEQVLEETVESRKLINNEMTETVTEIEDIESVFLQLCLHLAHDLTLSCNQGRLKKHKKDLYDLLARQNQDLQSFKPERALRTLTTNHSSIAELTSEKLQNLLVAMAIEHLHVTSSTARNRFPLLVTTKHKITDSLYIATQTQSLLAPSYSLYFDEDLLVVSSPSVAKAFIFYILYHDILYMQCQSENVYYWFNRIVLRAANPLRLKKLPERLVSLNKRLAKSVESSDIDDLTPILLSSTLSETESETRPRKRRRLE